MTESTIDTRAPESGSVIRMPESRTANSGARRATVPPPTPRAAGSATVGPLGAPHTRAAANSAARKVFDRGFLVAALVVLLAITVYQPMIGLVFAAAAVVLHVMRPHPDSRTRQANTLRAHPPTR